MQGDVPDFFHKLWTPSKVWPFFCLEGIGPSELVAYAAMQQVVIKPPQGAEAICSTVTPMGFSWAVFLAHSALEYTFENAFDSDDVAALRLGSPIPSLKFVRMVY